jgi:hypothetical protein
MKSLGEWGAVGGDEMGGAKQLEEKGWGG